jgi:hypothetical protein
MRPDLGWDAELHKRSDTQLIASICTAADYQSQGAPAV